MTTSQLWLAKELRARLVVKGYTDAAVSHDEFGWTVRYDPSQPGLRGGFEVTSATAAAKLIDELPDKKVE